MKASQKEQIRCPKSKLKTVKKAQVRQRKTTQSIKKVTSKKTESVPLDKKKITCKSCRRLRLCGKGACKDHGHRGRRTDPKTKENLRKLRYYLNAFILSTFNSVVATCISYAD